MLRGRLLPTFVTLVLAMAGPAWAAGQVTDGARDDNLVAALTGAAGRLGREAPLPQVLSQTDSALYQVAFDQESRGDWSAADQTISHIGDPLLVGHLMARRYLSRGYHAQAQELKAWLDRYAELPEADDIYALARERFGPKLRNSGLKQPVHPAAALKTRESEDDADWTNFTIDSGRSLTPADRRRVDGIKERFRDRVHADRFDSAVSILASADARRLLAPSDVDELKTVMAIALFQAGHDAEAVRWAGEAAERSGDLLPEAHWVAGLAMWRQGKHAQSAHHFEAVANAEGITSWLSSAGAFWAARANLAARKPEVVNHWLEAAASYPRTFYGLVARRTLGQDQQFSWTAGPFTDVDAETLERVPGARRALALLQIGDKNGAEDELRSLATGANPAMMQSLLALAYVSDMPALAISLDVPQAAADPHFHDAAVYPVPGWHPREGWLVDRALVFAIARQESGFDPQARSPAGAVGLMQLMPDTARAMGATGRLTDPGANLDAGQRYIRYLLNDDNVKGNLMLLAASYNSGPGAAARWMQTLRHNGDALLFMESIPARETRLFVERVLTNFWAYRNRLGENSPSLDSLAAGGWPIYDGNQSGVPSVRHAAN